MNIPSSAKTSKPSKSSGGRQANSPAGQSLKQHMQGLLLEGKVQRFLNQAYFEDEFLATQPDNDATVAEKIRTFAMRSTQALHYSATSDDLLESVFEGYSPRTPDPNFKPLPAERFIDELQHQAERFEITGNEKRSNVFKKADEILAGRTDMSLHDALKSLGGRDEKREAILKAIELKPNLISNEGTAVSELRQNVEILELKVQQAALAEQKAAGEKAPEMSPERAALREELHQARADLAAAKADPAQAEKLFGELASRKAAEGKTLTAKERAIQSPFTGTLDETRTSSSYHSAADAMKTAGEGVALTVGFAGLVGVVGAMSAAPGLGLLMNGVFLSDERSFTPAAIGVTANILGTAGILAGDATLAIPGLALSSICSFAAAARYHY